MNMDRIAYNLGRAIRKVAHVVKVAVIIIAAILGICGVCWDPLPADAKEREPEVVPYYDTEVVCVGEYLTYTDKGYQSSFLLDERDGDSPLMVWNGNEYVSVNHTYSSSHGNMWEVTLDWGEDTFVGDVFSARVFTQGTETPEDDVIINTGYLGYIPYDFD